jgi:hypothetical protein
MNERDYRDEPETCHAYFTTGGADPYGTGCDLAPGHDGPHRGADPFGNGGTVTWTGGGMAGGDRLPYHDVKFHPEDAS